MRVVVMILAAALIATACSADPPVAEEPSSTRAVPPSLGDVDETAAEEEEEEEAQLEPEPPLPDVDPASVGANEIGEVPVLMYHKVLASGGSEYDLTPEEFRGELQYLYDAGYRPIRTVDLVRGEIDVPAGTTPVVLTFDDSTREQFGYTRDGQVDPETALGILLDFADRYEDFEAVASVYVVGGSLFGGGDAGAAMLEDLHARGFEIGNHTYDHDNLGRMADDEVQQTLARNRTEIRSSVPDAEVATMALPLGVWPQRRDLAATGSAGPVAYDHEAVLLVGAHPAPSPFASEFEPLAIPRIRSSPSWDGGDPDFGSAFWFEILEQRPDRRYISDGDVDTISFPAELTDELADVFANRANPY